MPQKKISTKNCTAFLEKIDWKLLRDQKAILLAMVTELEEKEPARSQTLQGIIHLIDSIQDFAVDKAGTPERTVFGKLA